MKIAKLIPPAGDKHWSFQMVVHNEQLPLAGEFVYLMNSEKIIKDASPFLQGHSHNWAMVEFWTRDKDLAMKAAQKFAEHFGVELKEGDFTREELRI